MLRGINFAHSVRTTIKIALTDTYENKRNSNNHLNDVNLSLSIQIINEKLFIFETLRDRQTKPA